MEITKLKKRNCHSRERSKKEMLCSHLVIQDAQMSYGNLVSILSTFYARFFRLYFGTEKFQTQNTGL